ncbi:MAG: hypothetical protein ACJATV_000851 [Granulosicoccus sp.]|jgi:hypothetical protein
MNTLYILQNQHGHFLQKIIADKTVKKRHIWGDGQELNKTFRTSHKDEAINMMFESGSQDVDLRITIRAYPANTKGLPVIPTEDMPTPLPSPVTETAEDNSPGAFEKEANDEAAVVEQATSQS